MKATEVKSFLCTSMNFTLWIFIYNIKTDSAGKDPECSLYGDFAEPWRLDSGQIFAYIVRQPAPAADNGAVQELFLI